MVSGILRAIKLLSGHGYSNVSVKYGCPVNMMLITATNAAGCPRCVQPYIKDPIVKRRHSCVIQIVAFLEHADIDFSESGGN